MRSIAVNALIIVSVVSDDIPAKEQNDGLDMLVDGMMGSLVDTVALKAQPLTPIRGSVATNLRSGSVQAHALTPIGSGVRPLPLKALGSVTVLPAGSSRTGVVAQAKGQVFEVRQPKPLGLNFKNSAEGIIVSKVDSNADPRIQVGDKLLAVSASFGGEIWPALNYPQSMMAINTRIGQVYLKIESKGGKKNLFGKEAATIQEYVCLDCGWIYAETGRNEDFKDLANDFLCPQCAAPKKRFGKKDMATGEIQKSFDFNAVFQLFAVVASFGVIGFVTYVAAKL